MRRTFVDVGDDLRMAYVEEGPADGEPVLLLHGEPTWSFLYRKVMPILAAVGLRAIAPDLAGFGRSDKPDHTYARHVAWAHALAFQALDLTGVTLVGQDWGGLIGLRLVVEQPQRFTRVVAANTGLPTGAQQMPDVWLRFRDAVRTAPTLDVFRLVGLRRWPAPPWEPAGQHGLQGTARQHRRSAGWRRSPRPPPTGVPRTAIPESGRRRT
jgi:haloalkane dehalogenase